jgi:hypothetical protein
MIKMFVKDLKHIEYLEDNRTKIFPIIFSYWVDGDRYKLTLCITGIFANAGYTDSEIEGFIYLLCRLSSDNFMSERLSDVNRTYKRHWLHESVEGFETLRNEKLMRPEDIEQLTWYSGP